jgi:3-oxoacyl-[acyl-carrier protein] reductase
MMVPPAEPSLRDRVCIVTGGSRGLGKVMADALVDAGCLVAVSALREPEALRAVEAETASRVGPGRLIGIKADAGVPEDCAAVVEQTLRTFGAVHVLVNNAGRGMLEVNPAGFLAAKPFWEAPVAGWDELIAANVNGPFYMARAVAPHMVKRGFGRIVNISTSWGTMVRAGYSPYGPSKAALESCTAIWAKDLAGTGVTCNVLLPGGATDTRMVPGTGPDRLGPAGHPVLRPDIMAPPILWLASDRSAAWTGRRFVAKEWDTRLPPDEAAAKAASRATDLPIIL